MTNAALFDAWAAYEPSTTGAVTDLDAIRVSATAFDSSDRPSLLRERSQAHSMTIAAFGVLRSVMGPYMITQSALELEEEEPEIAEERLAELLDAAQTLKAKQVSERARAQGLIKQSRLMALCPPSQIAPIDQVRPGRGREGPNGRGIQYCAPTHQGSYQGEDSGGRLQFPEELH